MRKDRRSYGLRGVRQQGPQKNTQHTDTSIERSRSPIPIPGERILYRVRKAGEQSFRPTKSSSWMQEPRYCFIEFDQRLSSNSYVDINISVMASQCACEIGSSERCMATFGGRREQFEQYEKRVSEPRLACSIMYSDRDTGTALLRLHQNANTINPMLPRIAFHVTCISKTEAICNSFEYVRDVWERPDVTLYT